MGDVVPKFTLAIMTEPPMTSNNLIVYGQRLIPSTVPGFKKKQKHIPFLFGHHIHILHMIY